MCIFMQNGIKWSTLKYVYSAKGYNKTKNKKNLTGWFDGTLRVQWLMGLPESLYTKKTQICVI